MIDLHMHSTFSDGTLTPGELVRHARKSGITVAALTDHDSVGGIPDFLQASEREGITGIPGVELSIDARLPNHGHIHILGLFIDHHFPQLRETLGFLASERKTRALKIIQRLREMGIAIRDEALYAESGCGSIGRPHIANLLVRQKVVSSVSEAFQRYLGRGGPAYVEKVRLGEAAALRLIRESGGLSILAHPHLMSYDQFEETRRKIFYLKDLGLDGVEVFYSGMPRDLAGRLIRLARENNLLLSGGSDFHGDNKPEIALGSGINGDVQVPADVLTALQKAHRRKMAEISEQ